MYYFIDDYLRCLAEIRGNFTYLSEGVSKNKRCRIFRRNTVSGDFDFGNPKCATTQSQDCACACEASLYVHNQ